MGLERHEYRLKWWAQAWYLAWAAFAGGLGIIGFWVLLANAAGNSLADFLKICLFAIFMAAMGAFFLSLALRSRLVLDGTRISVRSAFREKSADLSEIKGYRVSMTMNATFWRLELSGDRGRISIMRSFAVDNAFLTFISHLKDLDKPDQMNLPG